jgi:hypothetical protein
MKFIDNSKISLNIQGENINLDTELEKDTTVNILNRIMI